VLFAIFIYNVSLFAGISADIRLAQSSKNEPDFSVNKQGDNLQVKTPASEPTDGH
jgi:hypothetical protein